MTIPKPMATVGKKPIIFYVMKIYQRYNYNRFLICAAYLHNDIEKYFKKNHTIFNKNLKKNKKNRIQSLYKIRDYIK